MPKHSQILPGRSHAIPSKRPEEAAPASDRARPLAPSAILQRAALAPQSLRPSDILRLQQTLGNRAVRALLSQFSPARSLVQAKLTVHAAGDQYEQEADRMAEAVTGMPAARGEELSRAEKPAVMRMPQPSPAAGGAFEASGAFERQLQAARGRGQPLPPALKADFETKFGADFGGVRVHADAHAGELNRSIAADAFTAGRDVFFRQGVYDPGSRDGQKLIAHELTHVLQQAADGAAVRSIQRRWVENPDGTRTWVPDDDPEPETQTETETPKRYGHNRDYSKEGQKPAPRRGEDPPKQNLPAPGGQDPPKQNLPAPGGQDPPKQNLPAPLGLDQPLDRPPPRLREFRPIAIKQRKPEPGMKAAETPQLGPSSSAPQEGRRKEGEGQPRQNLRPPSGFDWDAAGYTGISTEPSSSAVVPQLVPQPRKKALPSPPTYVKGKERAEPKPRSAPVGPPQEVPQIPLSLEMDPDLHQYPIEKVKNRPVPKEKKNWREAMHIADTPLSWTIKDQSNKQPAPDMSRYVPHTYRDIYDLKLRLEDAALTAAGEILDEYWFPHFEQIINKRRKASEWMKDDKSIEDWLEGGKVKVDEIEIKGDQEHVRQVLKNEYMRELAHQIYDMRKEKAGPAAMSGPEVMDAIKNAYVRSLNKEGWKPIQKKIKLEGRSDVINTMTPVNKYYDEQAFGKYGEGGWASMGRNLPLDAPHGHATNLWHSELTTSDTSKPIFEAFRSGSMGASRVGSEKQETEFSRQKAHEILQAIAIRKLRSEHEKRKRGYPKGKEEFWQQSGEQEEPLKVDVVSISLQTPAEFKVGSREVGKEGNELRDVMLQTEALKYWNGQSEKFRGPDGLPDRKVTYNIIIFNAGVNSVGFFAGQGTQNKINETAVDAFGKAYESWIEANPVPKDLPPEERRQLMAKRIIVHALMTKISKNYKAGIGTKDYKLPAQIANAGYLMGHIVQFNCKSGKDRTSVMDIESKFMAMRIQEQLQVIEQELKEKGGHTEGLRSHYKLKGANEANYRKLLLEGGNFELQKDNTGAAGYKIMSAPRLERIVQGRVGTIAAQVQGIAGAVAMKQGYKDEHFELK